jgi:hypothetical protein
MATTIASLGAEEVAGDLRHVISGLVDDDFPRTWRPGPGPAHVRLADWYVHARAMGEAVDFSMRSFDIDRRPRCRAITADERRMELDRTGDGAVFPQKQGATWDPIAVGRTPTARPFG